MGTENFNTPSQSVRENLASTSENTNLIPENLPLPPKKVKKIRKFLRCFIAIDNDVNEQTVMGVLFAFVTIVLITLHVAKVGKAGMDLIMTTGTMTLSCFGIAGLKR